jgi:hypothetical protein
MGPINAKNITGSLLTGSIAAAKTIMAKKSWQRTAAQLAAYSLNDMGRRYLVELIFDYSEKTLAAPPLRLMA